MRLERVFRSVGCLGLVAVLGSAAPPGASAQTPGQRPPPSTAGPVAPTLQGQLALSVHEAIAMGIENNLDVEVIRHDPLIARAQALSSWGAYDPEFFGEYAYASDRTPIASSLQASAVLAERTIDGAAGVRGLLPKLGWFYSVGYAGQSLETTSSISSLSPEYRGNLTANATMPLLRGFLWGEAWTQVKLTGLQSETVYAQFRQALMDVVRSIEDAYWNLAATKDQLRVADKSFETARELLDQTEAQYEVGVVSRVEVVEAEAGVAAREVDRIRAANSYEAAQDQLVDLVLGPFLQPGSELEVVTTDSPEDYRIFDVDPDQAASRAFEYRPELEVARQFIEQREIQLQFARNQRLPQVDLTASYGQAGLAGAANPNAVSFGGGAPPVVPRRYRNVLDDFFTSDRAESWSAGALVSIPIGNVSGRADVTAAKLELRRARTEARREEQRIILEVRDAIRNLRTALEGIEAAEKRRLAAAEQLRAERIRLEHGESTPFDVLQREEDLVDAESQKIGALQIYHSSVAALDRAQGTILRDRNVVVEEAARLR